ncbi:MAG TPA: C40 family peptidase [bacterium]|nr:C40 family peptidase [bacterium]
MKNGRIFLSLALALAFLAGGCASSLVPIYNQDGTQVIGYKTTSPYNPIDGAKAVAILKRPELAATVTSVENTHSQVFITEHTTTTNTNASGPNAGGGGGYVEPRIEIPRQKLVPGSVPYKLQAAVDAAREKYSLDSGDGEEDSNFIDGGLSSKRAQVLGEAKKLLGSPYQLGATGPNGYDCSGFTKTIYGRCGVDIPRSSSSQSTMGRPVSRQDLQPGDLVCWSGHVGIYAGRDMTSREVVIHANSTDQKVSISYMDDVGNPAGYRNVLD